jgi:hypothetical protein
MKREEGQATEQLLSVLSPTFQNGAAGDLLKNGIGGNADRHSHRIRLLLLSE